MIARRQNSGGSIVADGSYIEEGELILHIFGTGIEDQGGNGDGVGEVERDGERELSHFVVVLLEDREERCWILFRL